MSIQDYAVHMDFFQYDLSQPNPRYFPCNVCFHREKNLSEYPCKFCGHNEDPKECFSCSLCGELQEGNIYERGKYMAKGTPAQIMGVCPTCFETIRAEMMKTCEEEKKHENRSKC